MGLAESNLFPSVATLAAGSPSTVIAHPMDPFQILPETRGQFQTAPCLVGTRVAR